MSKADLIFKDMCESIINTGTSNKSGKTRPVWNDIGKPAHTLKKFGICNKYDLREEFPAITYRKTAIKSATDEVLWIYQKKSNNINDLYSNIWDEWADDTGSIGNAYGYQVRQKYVHHVDDSGAMILMDQMDAVLYDLKHDPYSRRIMTNLYNFNDLHNMHLYPCAYSCTFNVSDEGYDKPILNLLLNQRSQDVLAANNWNVCQYAIFLMMVAQVSDMIPGQLVHMIADSHIYDRHIDMVKELISRKTFDAPTVTLDTDIKDFYKFTKDSVKIENYFTGPQIKNIPIAI